MYISLARHWATRVAASLATKAKVVVQKLDATALLTRLLERGQILEWKGQISFPQQQTEWSSREEWNRTKAGWEWFFPFIGRSIDSNASGPPPHRSGGA